MRRSVAVFAFVAVAASGGAVEEPAGPSVSRQALAAHLRFLADDLLRGRATGSDGYRIAAHYVAAQFAQLGLEPAGGDGSFFQQVPYVECRLEAEGAEVEFEVAGSSVRLKPADDFVTGCDPVRERTAVAAGVVFAGFGVVAPEQGWDDYAGLDVAGRLVLTLSGAPARFPPDQRAHFSSGSVKAAEAAARGAVGLLSVHTRADAARLPWERVRRRHGWPSLAWVGADGRVHDHWPQLQGGALLSQAAAARLFEGSGTSLERVQAEADRGRVRGRALESRAALRRRSALRRLEGPNVAGALLGSDPGARVEHVVYTAHLDHLGEASEGSDDRIYNGAYDNAMGVAVLIETARLLAARPERPKRSVLFLAVGGEEHGLLGSDYFVRHPTVGGRLVANLNIDMPLFLHPVEHVVAFGAAHSSLGRAAASAAARSGFALRPDPMPEEVLFVRSDHYSFVRAGVPALMLAPSWGGAGEGERLFREYLRTHYHQVTDDLSRPVDWHSAERFTRLCALLGLQVADAPERPDWTPGDFFGERFGRAAGSPAPERR